MIAHRLWSGHVPLSEFKHLMGNSPGPNCAECDTMEDVHHLLVECVRTRAGREALKHMFRINFLDVGVIHSILSQLLSKAAIFLYKIVNKNIIYVNVSFVKSV